jgi:superfamily II DNA/RNA helicase
VISALQLVNASLPHIQAFFLTPTTTKAFDIKEVISKLGPGSGANCYIFNSTNYNLFTTFTEINNKHIAVGTPEHLLGLIRRDFLDTRRLKLLVLDDVDDLVEIGLQDKILEIYRHIRPLAQVVASSTTIPASSVKAAPKLLVDPLRIVVGRDEGVCKSSPHFFVKISTEAKPSVLRASSSMLYSTKIVVLCRNDTQSYVSLI